jgi:hypothetical protein
MSERFIAVVIGIARREVEFAGDAQRWSGSIEIVIV